MNRSIPAMAPLSVMMALVILLRPSETAARSLPESAPLAVRLQAVGGAMMCWDSLLELRGCTGEVILFFLNGETYLGPSCCRAIRVIEHSCWPAMLGTLGFTADEGDVLRGYCDAAADSVPGSGTSPPPPSPAACPPAACPPAS